MLVHGEPLLQRDDGFGCWRSVAKGAVGTLGILVTAPLLNENLSLLQRVEDLTVQQLVA